MEEIAKDRQLGVFNRGDHACIGTFPGQELDSPYSPNTVDVCPVGALTSRRFRFKQRVWNLARSDSICPGCARGCNVHVDLAKDPWEQERRNR
jgi:NADH-quinone oxidoreductase subunit G